jgi:starch synthase
MNILLQKAALDLMILLDEHPDVIHCHDGHAATLPAIMRENGGYRHYFRCTGAVVTIHNAGLGYHQEVEDLAFAHAVTGLPERVILRGRLEKYFDPFMVAADYAILNTVSEQYGRELQKTTEDARTGWLGHALQERGVFLAGITNGIDPDSFDPRFPEKLGLLAGYDVLGGKLEGKKECKADLLALIASHGPYRLVKQYGTLANETEAPLCTFIGRLTMQKGVDVLIQALHLMLAAEPSVQFLFLGSGMREFEEEIEQIATMSPFQGRICFLKGYDSLLANKVFAAGDFFIVPSQYEPCGLTDYIAQLFGNVPIVRRVGGLVKVINGKTGFSYQDNTPTALADTIAEALRLYRHHPHTLRSIQMAAVQRIVERHTWQKVMAAYLEFYRQAISMPMREH